MSKAQKEEYVAKTKQKPVDEMCAEEKEALIKKHKKQLFREVMFLEDMGCEISTILMEPSGQIFNMGSSGGENFLSSNIEITLKFKEHFASNHDKYDHQDLAKMFNEKYSEAVGKFSRVPYLKGGFVVKGLPDGIPFRKPTHYGHKQIQAIMSCKGNIVFELATTTQSSKQKACDTDSCQQQEIPEIDVHTKKELLTKICGEPAANRTLEGAEEKIKEDEVEVVSLSLRQDERLILYHNEILKHFDSDGILAVKDNLAHSLDITGMVIPTYTMTDEEFWLFYCNDRHPQSIQHISKKAKLRGYWLDRDAKTSDYKLLAQKTSVKAEAIITSAVGPLYFIEEIEVEEGNIFKPSLLFKKAILNTLHQQGFIKNLESLH